MPLLLANDPGFRCDLRILSLLEYSERYRLECVTGSLATCDSIARIAVWSSGACARWSLLSTHGMVGVTLLGSYALYPTISLRGYRGLWVWESFIPVDVSMGGFWGGS